MSDAEQQSGKAAMVAALNVPRNAKIGFGASVVLTVLLLAVFVAPGTTRPTILYLALAFVFAASMGGLLTALLTIVSAIRLSRRDPADSA